MLEEIQVPPGKLLEVMSLAELPAFRALISGAPICFYADMQLMRVFFNVQMLVHYFPGFGQAKAKGKNITCRVHVQVPL
jgi:hypothetical protein